jgi:hypothetical protein
VITVQALGPVSELALLETQHMKVANKLQVQPLTELKI